jgi:hypothetical protein
MSITCGLTKNCGVWTQVQANTAIKEVEFAVRHLPIVIKFALVITAEVKRKERQEHRDNEREVRNNPEVLTSGRE